MGEEGMTCGPSFSSPKNLPLKQSASSSTLYSTHQPHQSNAAMSILATPSPYGEEMCGPSPFLPDVSPSIHAAGLPPGFDIHGHLVTPPEVVMHNNQIIVSPTDQMVHAQIHGQSVMHRMHGMVMMPHPQHPEGFQPFSRPISQSGPRPANVNVQRGAQPHMHQRVHALQRPPNQHPSRPSTPQFVGDVFDPPHNRPAGIEMNGHGAPVVAFDFAAMQEPTYSQGISPIRALGPAPTQSHRFSPARLQDPNRTPTQNHMSFPPNAMSSASSAATSTIVATSTMDSSSTIGSIDRPSMHRGVLDTSDEETDSPTKPPGHSRSLTRLPLERPPMVEMPVRNALPPKKSSAVSVPARPPRPLPVKPLPVGGAGRTSAKFAKVAEDPGVEGVPPGPRPLDRPGPSFACIIGQAILRSSAGGLSLEHIYRYVETAYPFFKQGDGAWRNSVRHNLSIHKMFETIPRTEKFPPGKGGIWVIHEDEKCHWPEDDKFIKNFPSSHPHHGVCRQTLHERAKEQEARDKAAREGKAYVPKKGKKGRKTLSKDDNDDDSGTEMGRTSSMEGVTLQRTLSSQSMTASQSMPPPSMTMQPPQLITFNHASTLPPSPTRISSLPEDAAFDFDDDGDFVPIDGTSEESKLSLAPALEPESTPNAQNNTLSHSGTMAPPRFDRREKKMRDTSDDDENVFSVGPKRVRMAEPSPLSPVDPQSQHSDGYPHDDDMYITPARERTAPTFSTTTSAHGSLSSSAFKTPALVQTSSSPGSSPMPPTVGRGTSHHPSSLQQAWTHDDIVQSVQPSASSPAGLDAAFDFKPRATKTKNLKRDEELGSHLIHGHPQSPSHHSITTRIPPKTPVSRSSAATERTTPRLGMRTPGLTTKTPLIYGSPAVAPPSTTAHLSTPLWEMGNILERMKANPPESPLRTPRSPVPPTSPTRYSILLDSGASPKHRRDFSL